MLDAFTVVAIILQNFAMIGSVLLFLYAFYIFGKYDVFNKKAKLSDLNPKLDNIEATEEEREHERLSKLLRKHFGFKQ